MKAKKILSALVACTMALGVTAFAAVENEPKYNTAKLTGEELSFTANTISGVEKWGLEPNKDVTLDYGMVFSVDENEADNSPYAKYNADFIITFDKDIYSGDIGMYGNYGSYGWLGATLTDTSLSEDTPLIKAGEPVRTVSAIGFKMTFKEVCEMVGTFKCGVDIIDESLNDVKATIELCLYETYIDSTNSLVETGNSFVVGSSYTFSASNEPTWIYDTDAGYVTDDNGIMRFMFSADVTGTVTESGVKFMTSDMEATQGDITSTTAGNTFYADVINVPASAAGKTYYAKAYVKTENGSTYWSKALACTPNFSKLIAQ